MTRRSEVLALCYLVLFTSSALVLPTLALPSAPVAGSNRQARISPVFRPQYEPQPQQVPQYQPQYEAQTEDVRKYAEKPNASKKVINDNDLELQTNSVQEGFSWSGILNNIMQLLFAPTALNKSDGIDNDTGLQPSPWANIIAIGLKVLTAILGGGTSNGDGIDKVDNSSPLQGVLAAVLSAVLGSKDPEQVTTMAKQAGEFINIVVTLLDALKASFSHRAFKARSMGRRDAVSDAAVAGISLLKGYIRTFKTQDDVCMQKMICEANRECSLDMQGTGIYCQLGTYATSYMLEKSSVTPFAKFYDAGRRGRSGDDCHAVYQACNEV